MHFLLWPDNILKLTEGLKEQYIQHVDSIISAVFPNENIVW